jgi:hypothetical protein
VGVELPVVEVAVVGVTDRACVGRLVIHALEAAVAVDQPAIREGGAAGVPIKAPPSGPDWEMASQAMPTTAKAMP